MNITIVKAFELWVFLHADHRQKHFSLWMLKNFILLKTQFELSALHIVVFTYLEDLAGHKIKDCRLVPNVGRDAFGMLKFLYSLLGNETLL